MPPANRHADATLSERLSRLALSVIVLAILTVFVANIAEPCRMARDTHDQVAQLREQVRALRARNDAAERLLESLRTRRGVEIEARNQHLVRPSETPVRVRYRREGSDATQAAADGRAASGQLP
jgi:cell division protein FtsB